MINTLVDSLNSLEMFVIFNRIMIVSKKNLCVFGKEKIKICTTIYY